MKNHKQILIYVLVLFIIETLLQIGFYSLYLKHVDPVGKFDKLRELFSDGLYVVGSLKIAFFLPFYLLYYFSSGSRKRMLPSFRTAISHSVLFFFIYLMLSLFLPGDVAGDLLVTAGLVLIAFIVAFMMTKLTRPSSTPATEI